MIAPGTRVVVRTKNKWIVATISEKGKLVRKKSISKLSDVKDEGIVQLKTYLTKMKLDDKPEDIISDFGCESVYVFYFDEVDPDPKRTKRWWKNKNNVCLTCKKKCKQSSRVEIIRCNQYEEVI